MSHGATVLVADDDEAVRESVVGILRHAGYDVIEAEDGDVALERLGKEPVDVLVLDIRMPRLDGIAVLDAVDSPPPTLLVSAFSVDAATRLRLGQKVFTYCRKPVVPQNLLRCVSAAAEGR